MIIRNNFIDYQNNIQMSIAPNFEHQNIITTVKATIKGDYSIFKYYNFKEACQKYKQLEKEIEKDGK